LTTPVLFIVFNRPDLTRRVFDRIREARPTKLLVSSDGPRLTSPGDQSRVEEVREIIAKGVDWPCEVLTNYSNRNLGCREGPKSGIDWAFSLVEEAIIMEDDCLPDSSFFTFCEEMLNNFRYDERILHINGTNYIGNRFRPETSYFFSKYVWVWGWATWRRAWKHYDFTMASWDERLFALRESFDTRRERAFWMATFEEARRDWHASQAWDFPWIYSCWTFGGLTVMPAVNLIENIGFGPDATHTNNATTEHLRIEAANLRMGQQPDRIRRNRFCDDLMFRAYAGDRSSPLSRLLGMLRVVHRQLAGIGE
jgi:hypothetical protein